MKPQTLSVLSHLAQGRPLTALQALERLGIYRLAARVQELREAGYAVKTDLVRRGAKRFARYRMGALTK